MDVEFCADDFWNSPVADRIAKCREMAVHAERSAALAGTSDNRQAYQALAKEWRALADEIEKWGLAWLDRGPP